jgi:hypothetical protein
MFSQSLRSAHVSASAGPARIDSNAADDRDHQPVITAPRATEENNKAVNLIEDGRYVGSVWRRNSIAIKR